MDDVELLNQYINGSDEAFNKLYEKYHDRIFWFVYKYMHDEELAKDKTQDVFLRLARFADRYDPQEGAKFITWLYTIAKHVCINEYRRQNSQRNDGYEMSIDEEREIPLQLISDIPEPDRELYNKQRIEIIHKKLDQMNPNYAQVIKMRHFQGYSYEEISDILNISMGTVKSRIYRGRNELS